MLTNRSQRLTPSGCVFIHEEKPVGYDVLIKNGTLIDGTGSPARHGSIAITNGQIAEVGDIDGAATQIIDADGAVVAPGFI
ncbi:MAG TPA: hypothetical protein EYO66_00530, partial [Gammaproteobacteria bacterium]|nr:hypothetical protein [Gammaproteobacteria bacterium]